MSTSPLRAYERQEPCSTFYTDENRGELMQRLDKLESEVRKELRRQGFKDKRVHVERMLNMRFDGTDSALMVLPGPEDGEGEDFLRAFKRVYKSEFGFLLETKNIIVDDIRVTNTAVNIVTALSYGSTYRFGASVRRSTRSDLLSSRS